MSHPTEDSSRITPSGGSSEADGDLLARLATADVDALEALYDRYSGYVLALSWRVLGERHEAEEVVQDIFWQLWSGKIRYDPARGRFATWLYTVTRNRSIDRVRRLNVAGRGSTGEPLPEIHADADPEDEAGQAERRSAVREALRQLPDEQRQALELCFYEGLSHREASEQLRSPLGTVKSRIRAALMSLQRTLEQHR